MATKEFTAKQKEIVARKLGYDGPMQGFDEFIKSDPALQRKYGLVADKYMARGGAVRKYQEGGVVEYDKFGNPIQGVNPEQGLQPTLGPAPNEPNPNLISIGQGPAEKEINTPVDTNRNPVAPVGSTVTDPVTGRQFVVGEPTDMSLDTTEAYRRAISNQTSVQTTNAPVVGGDITYRTQQATTTSGTATPMSQQVAQTIPAPAAIPVISPAQTAPVSEQLLATQLAPSQAATVTAAQAPAAATAAAPTPATAATMEAATAAPSVSQAVSQLQPAQGVVSQQAQVQAAQAVPTSTALGTLKAAEGTATQITGAPIRGVQTGEIISGPAVDRNVVENTLQQAEAAQGVVTAEMTVQGQLNNLMSTFEAGNPPPWAAASLRNVTSVLAQRGLGASSLAGQALIQATLESALPIASADAQMYQQMGLQNLSNRQQTAMLVAQQRAQFLGQEFDQSFQTRVLNAAKIADIANQNFSAQQQVALENARLAQTMDMANLNNRQALVMANAAQIATLETANLNNRQQAAVANAQAFLQMDMTNLNYSQQAELFKAQSNVQSILSDQAAVNAARQFNAASQNQVTQFFAGLATQVQQFNATQMNAMSQFNADQYNTVARYNSEAQNQRDQFNAQNRLVIDQSNAAWRREVATANTAAINRANEVNAQSALQVGLAEYNNQMQVFRDNIQYAFTSGENSKNRENYVAIATLQKQAAVEAAKLALEGKMYEALGNVSAKVMEKTTIAGDAYSAMKSAFSSIKAGAIAQLGGGSGTAQIVNTSNLGVGDPGYGWTYYTDGTAIDPRGNYYYQGELVWTAGTGVPDISYEVDNNYTEYYGWE